MRMLVFASLLAASVASAEDLTIVSSVTRNGEPAGAQTSYLSEGRIRMAQPEGEFLLDNKTGNMTTIDNKKKEYSVVTPEDLKAIMAKMQVQAQKMEEQMKNMPPQAKALMEKMGGGGGTVNVSKTGPSRKIAGYSCETWTIGIGEIAKTEQCVTTELALPTQAWSRYKEFAEQMQGMLRAMPGRGPGGQGIAEKMSAIQGYPLSVVTSAKFMGKSSTTTSEVTEVRKGAIPDSAFEVPAGYKLVDSPMKKMLK